MKTLSTLKVAAKHNCVFCFFWIISIACLAIYEYYNVYTLFGIGVIAVYGWMVNPFAIISCFRCFKVYLTERKNPNYKQIIGIKWIWIFLFPIITTFLWLLGGVLFIEFTGGV